MNQGQGFLPRASGSRHVTRIRPVTWNRIADALNAGRIGTPGGRNLGAPGNWVFVKNDSGSDRERFECMALGDPLIDLTIDGQVDLHFSADTAAADKTPCILLEPIADGRVGRAVIHGLALAKLGSGSSTETQAAPGASHKLVPGSGDILLLASPDAAEDTLCPVLLGASGGTGEAKWWKYELTSDFTDETSYYGATADLSQIGTGDVVEEADIRDYIGVAVHQVTGDHGLVTQTQGIYLVVTPECNFLTPIPIEP